MPFQRLDTQLPIGVLVRDLAAPARVVGDPDRPVSLLGPLSDAGEQGLLCFCNAASDATPARIAPVVNGSVVIRDCVDPDAAGSSERTLIMVPDPRRYFLRIVRHLCGEEHAVAPGIHPSAHIAPEARIGNRVAVGPNAYIEGDVEIGDGCRIGGNVQIYAGSRIGGEGLIQANAVIGCIGQSYERDETGQFLKMPHLCGVVLGDRIHIGVGASIVRGTLQDTVIGSGTAIGNQANIGHNVTIGQNCHIGAGVIVCGSSALADDVWLSIGAIVRSVAIGAGTMVGAGAVVTRPVESGMMVNGFPARTTPKINDYNSRIGR